jgi:hypothetical protein
MANKEFTDQNFRQLCDVVKSIYTDPEHVRAVGWDAQTPLHHLEGAVVAEIHSRMEEFIGENLAVEDRERARNIPPEAWSESHTRRRREEIINFLRSNRSANLSHPDAILNETIGAVIDRWHQGMK